MLHSCQFISFRRIAAANLCRCSWTSPTSLIALNTSTRTKATHLRIANRKRVEMFVGKRFHLPTRLRTAAPEVAAEWDYERNPMHLYPEIVGIGYMSPVAWRCSACGSPFEMSVEKRIVRGGGCPSCAAAERSAIAEKEKMRKYSYKAQEAANSAEEGGLLEGERDASLRPKRPTVFNLRTKY